MYIHAWMGMEILECFKCVCLDFAGFKAIYMSALRKCRICIANRLRRTPHCVYFYCRINACLYSLKPDFHSHLSPITSAMDMCKLAKSIGPDKKNIFRSVHI